jgi:hypothetical protein
LPTGKQANKIANKPLLPRQAQHSLGLLEQFQLQHSIIVLALQHFLKKPAKLLGTLWESGVAFQTHDRKSLLNGSNF